MWRRIVRALGEAVWASGRVLFGLLLLSVCGSVLLASLGLAPGGWWLPVALGIPTAGAFAFGVYWYWRAYHRPDPPPSP